MVSSKAASGTGALSRQQSCLFDRDRLDGLLDRLDETGFELEPPGEGGEIFPLLRGVAPDRHQRGGVDLHRLLLVPRSGDDALGHFREMAAVSSVPVNGDFEGGFAIDPEGVAVNVGRAAETGVAGLSIEDSTGDADNPLFDFQLAVGRVRAARQALDAAGSRVLLTARSEGFIVGRPDLAETLRRLEAFAAAGAECLYAPGIRTRAEIGAVVRAVAPKPVNVLVGADFTTVEDLASLGVRRISVGGALARAALTGFVQAAQEIADHGTFSRLGQALPFGEVNGWFPRE